MRSITLLRPLNLYDFSLSRNDHNRGRGYRCKICTVPTPFLCLPDPLEKMRYSNSGTYVYLMWLSRKRQPSSNPLFSRACQAVTKTVWGPYRPRTNTLPLDYDRCVKEKNRKKSGWKSVVLRTLPVLQLFGNSELSQRCC